MNPLYFIIPCILLPGLLTGWAYHTGYQEGFDNSYSYTELMCNDPSYGTDYFWVRKDGAEFSVKPMGVDSIPCKATYLK